MESIRATRRNAEERRETRRKNKKHTGSYSSSASLRVISAFLSVPLLFLATTLLAQAHGIGTPQLLNVPSGPYLLSVWTDPDPLRADEAHVVVAVLEPATREPIVTGVEVTVTMTPLAAGDGAAVSMTAGADETNRLFSAAEFHDRVAPGRWRVGVSVAGERGAGEEVTFEIDITAARGFNWLWLGAGGLALAVGLWLTVSLRPRATGRTAATSAPPRRP